MGVTETEAKARGIDFGKGMFPWAASGRSLALNRDEGFTKILFDKETHRVIGGGIVGTNAGDLICRGRACDRDGRRRGGYRTDHPCRIRRCRRRWHSPRKRSKAR